MKKKQKKPEEKLTLKQKLFCDWYLKLGGSRYGAEAARRAGYSEHTAQEIASENLSKPMVQAYLTKRRTEIEDLLGFNKITIVQDLMDIRDRSLQRVPVMKFNPKTRENEQVKNEDGEGVWQFDSNGANRAVENINKMMDYYAAEKVEDVTPLERKAPTTVVVNKTYADKESDQPTP